MTSKLFMTNQGLFWLRPQLHPRRRKVDQTSRKKDEELHEASIQLGFAKAMQERATQLHDQTWERIRGIFGEFPALGKRFLARDGFYLQDQRREGSPKLFEDELYTKLHAHWEEQPELLKRMWNRITVTPPRVVDTRKLEQQVKKGNIPEEIVDSCIHTPDPTYARIRNAWTAEDYNRAVVLDVALLDSPDVLARHIEMLTAILVEMTGTAMQVEEEPSA